MTHLDPPTPTYNPKWVSPPLPSPPSLCTLSPPIIPPLPSRSRSQHHSASTTGAASHSQLSAHPKNGCAKADCAIDFGLCEQLFASLTTSKDFL